MYGRPRLSSQLLALVLPSPSHCGVSQWSRELALALHPCLPPLCFSDTFTVFKGGRQKMMLTLIIVIIKTLEVSKFILKQNVLARIQSDFLMRKQ